MKVLAHPDPNVLEQELLDRLARARVADTFRPLLVLVPTVRLGRHLQRRLAAHLGACLAVDVLHHGALIRQVLDASPGQAVRTASPRVLAAFLEKVLAGMRSNPWAAFVRDRPGALPGLFRAVNDLREAGLEPGAVRAALGGGPDAPLAEVYTGYVAALGRSGSGLTDRAGLVKLALPGVPAYADRYGAIFHHGAYELIGIHLELVRAIDAVTPVTFLLSAEPGTRVTAHAERFASAHLVDPGVALERLQDRAGTSLLGSRLTTLYDEAARPEPLQPGGVRLRHTQGARDEVTTAVHSALDAVERGTPGAEIMVVARSLEPYAATLEEVLDGTGEAGAGRIRWTSSLGGPLRRDPQVRDLMLLLQVVGEGFPRAATAELLASPHVRWPSIGIPGPPRADTAEAWSRKAGIVGGLSEWCADLMLWARQVRAPDDATDEERASAEERARVRGERAGKITDALEALSRRIPSAARTWSGHASRIESLVREVLPGLGEADPGPAMGMLLGLLDEMRDLEHAVGDARRVSSAEMLEWLARAVDTTPLPLHPDDRGGLRVLDAMQARGLTADRVIWIGFQSGLFPRPAREDPFLPDRARRRLREATGRPLPLKAEGEEEERLLLPLILGSAREGIEISWQRSDEAGRPRNPSLALREVARLLLGRPDAAELAREPAARVRSHPKDMLEDLERASGILAPEDDLLLVALRSVGDPDAERALLAREPALGPGLAMMQATESLATRDLRYDGRVGLELADRSPEISVSAFQQLGRCPLQFFFRQRLHVRPLHDESGPFELASREMGNRVHRILERLYRQLQEEELFAGADALALIRRARLLLPSLWSDEMEDLGERVRRRTPVLWAVEEARWRSAIEAFVDRDLERIRAAGWLPEGFELQLEEVVSLGDRVDVRLRGRLDRILTTPDGRIVGDYKTSGRLKPQCASKGMLRGERLQVPLYGLLAGAGTQVELLGVGPDYADGGKLEAADERLATFAGPDSPDAEVTEGILETLRVLQNLRESGTFALRFDDRRCGWCDYRRACRRNHPPTRHREAVSADTADLRGVGKKSERDGVRLESLPGASK